MQKINSTKVKEKGFTLLEVVIAISIIALLAAFVLPGLLQNREDAKLSTALTQLQKDFPSAITRQVTRTQQCTTTNMSKANLQARGLPALTVWNTQWTPSVVGTNTVQIVYTIDSTDTATASDLAAALNASNNVQNATATGNASVTVTYRCN